MQSVDFDEQVSTDHDYHLHGNILHQDQNTDHNYYSQPSIQQLPLEIAEMDPAIEDSAPPENENDPVDPQQLEIRELSPSPEEHPINPNLPIIIPTKRKRSLTNTPKAKNRKDNGKNRDSDDDEDEGLTCPICFDNWEMSGDHRLVSLKCGHLFGESCIRRWLIECAQTGPKTCPKCKARVINKDIRCLYAKRLRAIDRSEEHRLREEFHAERLKSTKLQADFLTLQISYSMMSSQMEKLESENDRLKKYLRSGLNIGYLNNENSSSSDYANHMLTYKLFMEKNIEISKEPGCRVMIFAVNSNKLIVSQRSTQTLFPGYGLRFIDTPTFQTSTFLHASAKPLRDIALSSDENLLSVASLEQKVKLFDMRVKSVVSQFSPSDKSLWACAMDRKEREHSLYLGAHNGSTFVYDIRMPDSVALEFKTVGDLSPVVNIAPVPGNQHFPNGGFLVCKLQSLWFYEYTTNSDVKPAKLNAEGPFISMSYDSSNETILLFTRSNSKNLQSRYIVGKLDKINAYPVFATIIEFYGSKTTPVMTRCSQIAVEKNTLVAGYIQDTKLLSLFDVKRTSRLQSMPVQEVVYDTCPVYMQNSTYLAALTETKCRIYKLTSVS